ncbi:MAG: hypothetical protein KatS3mg023_1463 [Armatimonadota bacterium]|nr:MAG: hypothetical protein KatS3mg023_1463 [Armatimonadota bacterium]
MYNELSLAFGFCARLAPRDITGLSRFVLRT